MPFTFARDDANNNVSTSTACAAVHIIVARASQEPPGQGSIGTLATKVATNIPGTSVEWVQYPALLFPYDTSSTQGTEAATAAIKSYTSKCPGKIVLFGYSQGAQVMGDVMCGGGGAVGLGPWTPPIASSYSDKVVAVVQMGDPRHMIDVPWDAGTAKSDGLFPRPANISCTSVGSKFKSYCDDNDPFCARGFDINVHTSYLDRYAVDAYNFVVAKLKAVNTVQQTGNGTLTTPAGASGTSGTSGTTTTSGATATASGHKSDGTRQTTVGAPLALVLLLAFAILAEAF